MPNNMSKTAKVCTHLARMDTNHESVWNNDYGFPYLYVSFIKKMVEYYPYGPLV